MGIGAESLKQEKYRGRYDAIAYGALVFMAFSMNISTAGTSCAIGLLALVTLVRGIHLRIWPELDGGVGKVFLAYFLLEIAIAALSIDAKVSLREVVTEIHRSLPIFFALWFLKTKSQIKHVLLAFLASSLINDFYAMYQCYWLGFPRAIAFSHSWTFLGSFLLMQIPILVLMMTLDFLPQWARRVSGIAILISLQVLVLSGTRGAWLALFGVLVSAAVLDKRCRSYALKTCGVLLVATGLLYFASPAFQARADTLADPQFQSNQERVLMWQSAMAIIRDYPVHGIGQDMFGLKYNTEYISLLARERAPEGDPLHGHGHPHNNVLKVTSEGGVLGLCSFLLLHGYFFFRFWRLYRADSSSRTISCGMAAMLILLGLQFEGMTDTNMNQVPIMREYWLLAGVLMQMDGLRGNDGFKS